MRENLLGPSTGRVRDGELWAVLGSLGLAGAVRTRAGGLDHVLGARGGDLSQGQRQLLCLARALLVARTDTGVPVPRAPRARRFKYNMYIYIFANARRLKYNMHSRMRVASSASMYWPMRVASNTNMHRRRLVAAC